MNLLPVVPFLFLLLWVGLIIYAVVLANRFVNAVEQIARALARQHPPDVLKPE